MRRMLIARAKTPLDLIMYIGRGFYTIESFIAEAKILGCCKRVSGIPRNLVVGKSRVYLAHDTTEEEKKSGKRGPLRIFGYFVVRGIEAVMHRAFSVSELTEMGVKILDIGNIASRPREGCGFQKTGGFYLVSSEDMDKLRDQVKTGDLSGAIYLIIPRALWKDSM